MNLRPRFPAVILLVTLLVSLLTAGTPAISSATTGAVSTTTSVPDTLPSGGDGGLGHSIQLPNSGTKPLDAGDRGGALQLTLVSLIGAGLVAVAGLAWRDISRSRDRSRKVPPNLTGREGS